VLEAMGLETVSLTQRAFNDASLRASTWPPTKSGGAPLKKTGALWHSIRIAELTNKLVKVGTDRPYAPYHQFGTDPYTIRPSLKKALFWPGAAHPMKVVHHPGLPARPFFPFTEAGAMIAAAAGKVKAAAEAKIRAMLSRAR
jgi:phage gpG-like protein